MIPRTIERTGHARCPTVNRSERSCTDIEVRKLVVFNIDLVAGAGPLGLLFDLLCLYNVNRSLGNTFCLQAYLVNQFWRSSIGQNPIRKG